MSDRLPPEIWLRVIQLLRRPIPRPGDLRVDWGDLHQHDLTTMMRVCRTFNHLAGPVLYSEIVVLDPVGLLYGVDRATEDEQPDGSSTAGTGMTCNYEATDSEQHQGDGALISRATLPTLHKRDLLRLVTAIHYVSDQLGDFQTRHMYDHFDLERYNNRYCRRLKTYGYPISDLLPRLERRTFDCWTPRSRSFDLSHATDNGRYHGAMSAPRASFSCRWPAGECKFADCVSVDEVQVEVNSLHNWSYNSVYSGLRPYHYLIPGARNDIYADPSYYSNRPIAEQLHEERTFRTLVEGIMDIVTSWEHKQVDEVTIAATRINILFPRPTRGQNSAVAYDAAGDLSRLLPFFRRQYTIEQQPDPLYLPPSAMCTKVIEGTTVDWADTIPACKACGALNPAADVEDKGWSRSRFWPWS